MQKFLAMIQDPANLPYVTGAGVAVIVLLLLVQKSMGSKNKLGKDGQIKGMDKLLREGRYAEAADLAMKNERPKDAIDYFLRAQRPANAARIAAQIGDHRRAAELYERAGNLERAAFHYERLGNHDKARTLRAALPGGAQANAARAAGGVTAPPPPVSNSAPSPASAGVTAPPPARAQAAESRAEQLLAEGDIEGAAAAFKEAGAIDQAVHLYANVLGMPAEAAALLADQGNHERAAELYELAGRRERAAALWAKSGLESATPEMYVDRIIELSQEIALQYLDQVTEMRPLSPDTAELYYKHGTLLSDTGDRERAVNIFVTIQRDVGEYRDVGSRIHQLQVVASSDAGGSTETLPPGSNTGPQPVVVYQSMPEDMLKKMAREAVSAAAEDMRRRSEPPPPMGSTADTHVPNQGNATTMERGKSAVDAALETLIDSAVQRAKFGPSTGSLQGFIAGNPCDLQNIEVYYRLGLAYLAEGNFGEALAAFKSVEEASHGYRDAGARVEAILAWRQEQEKEHTYVGVQGRKPPAQDTRYLLEGELGRGGMAVVFRAKDQVLGRDVALKFLSSELSAREDVRNMFQREARSVAQLNHPNIVTIYDFGTLDGRTYIAMEYVEGNTVKDLIETNGKLNVMDTLTILTQLLGALEAAHNQQIIHRDIKPSNIMKTDQGLIKLMDFGLAKSVAAGAQASIVAGTPSFMSPEQMVGGEVDHRTDLYAVGVMLYQMLTGKLPFKALDRTRPPVPVREIANEVPEFLEKLAMTAIEAEPSRRIQTARAFKEPIEGLLSDVRQFATGDVRPA